MADSEYSQISTTTDSVDEADDLARTAVKLRVAACAQVLGPITSIYRWEGRVDDSTEWLVLFKTADDRVDALQAHILGNHSYAVPEVIRTPITGGSPAYLAWLTAETRPA